MYDSKNTVLDLSTSSKRAFVFLASSEYRATDYLAVVVVSQKTGRQLASYALDMGLVDDVKAIKTLGALVKFSKSMALGVAS